MSINKVDAKKQVYLLPGDFYHSRKTRVPLICEMLVETGFYRPTVAYIWPVGRVDNIGDISPAIFVHQSAYEYQI